MTPLLDDPTATAGAALAEALTAAGPRRWHWFQSEPRVVSTAAPAAEHGAPYRMTWRIISRTTVAGVLWCVDFFAGEAGDTRYLFSHWGEAVTPAEALAALAAFAPATRSEAGLTWLHCTPARAVGDPATAGLQWWHAVELPGLLVTNDGFGGAWGWERRSALAADMRRAMGRDCSDRLTLRGMAESFQAAAIDAVHAEHALAHRVRGIASAYLAGHPPRPSTTDAA